MASNINDTIPTSGSPAISSDVRSNFVAAKAEIDTLQAGGYTHNDGQYLATDEIKAIDGDGLKLYDDDGNGIFVKDGGRLGFGTTNPDGSLHVREAGAEFAEIRAEVVSVNHYARYILEADRGSANQRVGSIEFWNQGGTAAAVIDVLRGSSDTQGHFRLSTSNSEALRVDQDGKLGLSTASPTLTSNGKLDMNADIVRLRTAYTPGSAGHTGNQGETCWDVNYMYVCVATNSWHRAGHSTW